MCDGTAYPREGAYANLFQVIGVSCGAPDATSFNVPDLRGRFLRGADDPDGAGTRYERANRDPDAASRGEMKPGGETGVGPGTIQASEFGRHSHGDVRFAAPGHQHWMPLGGDGAGVFYSNVTPGTRVVTNRTGLAWGLLGKSAASGGPVRESPTYPNEDTAAVPADGGKETRPVNATVNYIIKY
jgi:microcystin-dependent protein